MTTSTEDIRQDFDRRVRQIRSNADLSAEAKRRHIAHAYEEASKRYYSGLRRG